MEEYNLRRGLFKKHVKRFYYACRRFDEGLRARMNACEAATANRQTKTSKTNAAPAGTNAATASAVPGAKAPSAQRRQDKPSPQLQANAAGANEPVNEA